MKKMGERGKVQEQQNVSGWFYGTALALSALDWFGEGKKIQADLKSVVHFVRHKNCGCILKNYGGQVK